MWENKKNDVVYILIVHNAILINNGHIFYVSLLVSTLLIIKYLIRALKRFTHVGLMKELFFCILGEWTFIKFTLNIFLDIPRGEFRLIMILCCTLDLSRSIIHSKAIWKRKQKYNKIDRLERGLESKLDIFLVSSYHKTTQENRR